MGVVAVARENVQEWLQPTPFTVLGVAAVVLDNAGEVVVEVVAQAALVASAAAPTQVVVAGDGPVSPFGDVQFFPRPIASAEIAVEGSVEPDQAKVTAGVAVADIRATVIFDGVGVAGDAAVVAFGSASAAPAVLGDAEVSFGSFGDGDYPIFPFRLPYLFTGNPQNIQDAAAEVVVSAVGDMDGVAGVAGAVLTFTGDVVLTRKGSTPIFPFAFPVVFDAPANIQVGSATLAFDADSECVVDVIGESAVAIDGTGISYGSAVFPWTFPVALVAA